MARIEWLETGFALAWSFMHSPDRSRSRRGSTPLYCSVLFKVVEVYTAALCNIANTLGGSPTLPRYTGYTPTQG